MLNHLPKVSDQDKSEAHKLRFETITRQLFNTPKKLKIDELKTEQTSEKKQTN